jgi:ubiquitin-conjugating enzyme E2 T
MSHVALGRIRRELEMLANDPGPGVSGWPLDDNILCLEAQIQGPEGSPYEEGTYTLHVQLSDRYPLEPPRVRFVTPIYHPNIDSDGRICLDTLKMQPQGTWSPCININTLLLTIRVLMAQPNPDDGLVPEITEEYRRDPALWHRRAQQHARSHAVAGSGSSASGSAKNSGEGGGGGGQKHVSDNVTSASNGNRSGKAVLPEKADRTEEAGHVLGGAAVNGEKSAAVVGGEQADDGSDDEEEEEEEDDQEEEEDDDDDVCTSSFADQDSASLRKKSRLL